MQFNVKVQRGVRRNDWGHTPCTIAEFRRNDKAAMPTNFHAGHAKIPTLDDGAGIKVITMAYNW